MAPVPSPVQAKIQTQTPKKQLQPHHIEKKKQPTQPNVEKQWKPTPTKSAKPPVDYQVLLLSLADEYLNAAHARGTATSLTARETDIEEYYKLVATGLGCLEAVLKVGELPFLETVRPSLTNDMIELAIATSQRSSC